MTTQSTASTERLVILSTCVFPATGTESFDGFVATEGNAIVAVGPREEAAPYVERATRVIDAGDRTVLPGLCDNHTFFTGWALLHLGCDLSGACFKLLQLVSNTPSTNWNQLCTFVINMCYLVCFNSPSHSTV